MLVCLRILFLTWLCGGIFYSYLIFFIAQFFLAMGLNASFRQFPTANLTNKKILPRFGADQMISGQKLGYYAPGSTELTEQKKRLESWLRGQNSFVGSESIPEDALALSASGADPHILRENALVQFRALNRLEDLGKLDQVLEGIAQNRVYIRVDKLFSILQKP
jgi:K+-transporting ATPase c subunit